MNKCFFLLILIWIQSRLPLAWFLNSKLTTWTALLAAAALSWCYHGCIFGHYDHFLAIRWVQFAIFWRQKRNDVLKDKQWSQKRQLGSPSHTLPSLLWEDLWCSRPQGLIQPQKLASMRDFPTKCLVHLSWTPPPPLKGTVSGFQNTLAHPHLKFFKKWWAKEGFWPLPCRYFSACANSFTELEKIPHAGCEGGESLRWKMAP